MIIALIVTLNIVIFYLLYKVIKNLNQLEDSLAEIESHINRLNSRCNSTDAFVATLEKKEEKEYVTRL